VSASWVVVIGLIAAGGTDQQRPTAAEEVRSIVTAHRTLQAFDLRIDAWLGSTGASEPLTATVKCDGHERCLRVFQSWTTLETPALSLVVDERERTITVMRGKVTPARGSPALEPRDMLQAWLDRGGKVAGGETTPEGRRWTFERADAAGPPAAVYVDEHTHLLRRLVYGQTEPGGAPVLIDVHYTWGDGSRLDASDFDVGRFVAEEGDAITPAEGYAGYRIIRTDRR